MSLANTIIQDYINSYEVDRLDKNEVRQSRYGAWDFFQEQTDRADSLITEGAKEAARNSIGNVNKIPVINKKASVTISNTRTCTISADPLTSALVTLTWATVGFSFQMNPASNYNNYISYEEEFRAQMRQGELSLAAYLDDLASDTLEANKNQYFPTNITSYYPEIGDALQVSQAQKDDFFNQLQAIMEEMDYYGEVNVIANARLRAMLNRLQAQGGGNATNQAFQFELYKWWFTNRIIPADGMEATVFSVPDGMVSVLNRNTPDNRRGSRVGDMREWGEAVLPILGLNMGTYYTRDCGDGSALNGGGSKMAYNTRTLIEGFAFDTDICFLTAYNSAPTTSFSPILKTEISLT